MTQNLIKTVARDVADRLYSALLLATFAVLAVPMVQATVADGPVAGVVSVVTTVQSVLGGIVTGLMLS